ncbi:MAG: hypothetical protein LBH74_03250 [Nitrososphaerota archaeon]|jgi:hypothetical protein|nr:hypothetical protein [Nitrososphaerota archaeon]
MEKNLKAQKPREMTRKIQHDSGACVLVCDGENPLHGKGMQVVQLIEP